MHGQGVILTLQFQVIVNAGEKNHHLGDAVLMHTKLSSKLM